MFTNDKIKGFSESGSRKRVIACAVLFQLVWFACILTDFPIWLPSVISFFLVYYFVFRCHRYTVFVVLAAALGISVDFILFSLGAIRFDDGVFPFWLIALWLVFAASIPLAFGFLKGRYILAFLLGGPGGASSYYAASRFRDDVTFAFGEGFGIFPLVALWALLMPSLLFILSRTQSHLDQNRKLVTS